MQQRVVTGGFIFKDGKFLIVKRAQNETFYANNWEIPGGKLEFEEIPEEGVKREVLEEVGLEIEVISPISTWTYELLHNETQYIQIDYLVKPIGDSEIKLSEEHDEFIWITFDEIDNYEMSHEMKSEIVKLRDHRLVKEALNQTTF